MTEFPLRLERYFFTEQSVTANPDFKDVGAQKFDFSVDASAVRIDDQPGKYGVTAKANLNPEKSDNVPYFFSITAFGILCVKDNVDISASESYIETSGAQLLIGAIRERLAEMTARGPWGIIHLDFVPMMLKIDSKKIE